MTTQELEDIILLSLYNFDGSGYAEFSQILVENDIKKPVQEALDLSIDLKKGDLIDSVSTKDGGAGRILPAGRRHVETTLLPKYDQLTFDLVAIQNVLFEVGFDQSDFNVILNRQPNYNKVQLTYNIDNRKPYFEWINYPFTVSFNASTLPLAKEQAVSLEKIHEVFTEWASKVYLSKPRKDQVPLFHALSTNQSDLYLRKLGFENQGVVGYILTQQMSGAIRFHRYHSEIHDNKFFYSAFSENEALSQNRLMPLKDDEDWFVMENEVPGALPLRRFYKRVPRHTGDHFYASKPIVEKLQRENYAEETPQGYVYAIPGEGRKPLYVYSTTKDKLFFDAIESRSGGINVRGKPPTVIFQPSEPLLNVKELAEIFVDLIFTSIGSKDPQEQFYGIFGRWGRGKTYFWEQCKKQLAKKQDPKLKLIDFHAWKYQDTPSVWAYLYETIADQYYVKTKWPFLKPLCSLLNICQSLWLSAFRDANKLILLSLGILGLLYFEMSASLTAISPNTVGVGVSFFLTIYGAINSLKKPVVAEAKRFIMEFSKRQSYKLHLGLQHEIQEELKSLLKAWFFFKKSRLILFVDDIDRCSESKIISIVDSIRVMLHDEYLQKH